MAADLPGDRNSAEMMAECAEDLATHGHTADALEWFSRIVEGGEPELGPHAALRIAGLLVDDDLEAAQAALRYAADNGTGDVAEIAADNLSILAEHEVPTRTEPATLEEVVGRTAIARVLLLSAEGDAGAVAEVLQQAAECPVPDIAAAAAFELGNLLEDNGDLAGAQTAYRQAAELRRPRVSGQAAINLGLVLSKQMDVRGAHAAYSLAVEVGDPDDVAKGNGLLEQLAALGDLDEVHARAQQLDLTDPDLVGGSAVAAGEQYLGDGDLQSALRAFEKAMDTGHPVHAPEGAAWVAAAFYQVEGMHGAEAAIGRLAEIGRADLTPRAWFMFGCRLVNGGNFKDGEKAWKRPVGDARAAAECGRQVVRGKTAKAEAAFEEVLTVTPDLAGHLGGMTLQVGDLHTGSRAKATYELALRFGERSELPWLIEEARASLTR
ncbi:tetratricopeptide repeat protein [Kribbella soli]|uniref:Tetratricopeptide repeat protein n=2 Tax=Kribbella soli TaxID=1124743 RepID=A0A4R0HH84_9ACTN|nr:tetratricopeptide repeat protein [Kribbella soli]